MRLIKQKLSPGLRFITTVRAQTKTSEASEGSLILKDVLQRLEQQQQSQLDAFTCVKLIRESSGSLGNLKKLASYIAGSPLQKIIYIHECLVHGFLKRGSFEDAKLIFDKLHQSSRDETTWTAILGAYSRQAGLDRGFKLYNQMLQAGVKPDMYTFTTMLAACVTERGLREGKTIHLQILELGLEGDVIMGTSIISMYGKCGCLEEARACFDRAPRHDPATWNTMISTYVQYELYRESFHLFRLMLLVGVMPNLITLVTVLNGCNSASALAIGRTIRFCARELGFESDVVLGTALLNMYARCGSLSEASGMFSRIEAPDIVSWNSLFAAHLHSDVGTGRALFRQLLLEGVRPNEVTFVAALNACTRPGHLQEGFFLQRCLEELGMEGGLFIRNALIDMLGKCGAIRSAEAVFEEKNKVEENSLVTWSVMISAYTENWEAGRAVELFKLLLCEGFHLDCIVFINLLNACAAAGNLLAQGKLLHRSAAELGLVESDLVLASAVINMYVKCGDLELALEVFDEMKVRNAVSWNTMMSGYTRAGRPKEALALYERMDPGMADQTSYVAALDACSSLTAIAEGRMIHQRVIQRRISCDLVLRTALVNLYGKCGCLDEARQVFDQMAGVDTVMWNSMLAAYAQLGCISQAFRLLSRMEQEGVRPDAVTFVSVLCACSRAGSLELGDKYFVSMRVEHRLEAGAEHYACMLDLLSRLGMLEEAEYLIAKLPRTGSGAVGAVEWSSLLAACSTQREPERARTAAGCLMGLRPRSSGAYAILSNSITSSDSNLQAELPGCQAAG